jgi:hypothetical protein
MAADSETTEPNLYMLTGDGGLQVTYSTSSFRGGAQFNYNESGKSLAFGDDEIEHSSGPLGGLVTVTIEQVPDLHDVTATLLLPEIHLIGNQTTPFRTWLVRTTNRSNIGGPKFVVGALKTYECVQLTGTAQAVLF